MDHSRIKEVDVILTNAYNRIGYNILRSLFTKGLGVGVGTDQNSGMSVFSRYKSFHFYHPSHYDCPSMFIERIKQILLKHAPSVYMPSDEDAFVISKYRAKFTDIPVRIPIAAYSTLNLLNNKSKSTRLAKSLGIPTPDTIIVNDEDDLAAFRREYGEPIVLKLLESSGAHGVFYLTDKNWHQTLDYIHTELHTSLRSFIAQRCVSGIGHGVSMLMNNGKLIADFTHKRLGEVVFSGGPSSIRVSTRNPMMQEYAHSLLSHLGYHGVAMVEFKYNEKTKEIWFIEVNPRFWGSLGLAVQSGVDFPYLLYKMATEGDVKPVLNYKLGVRVQWIMGSILGAVDELRSTAKVTGFKQVITKADAFDDFYPDDPFAFLGQAISALKKKYESSRRITMT